MATICNRRPAHPCVPACSPSFYRPQLNWMRMRRTLIFLILAALTSVHRDVSTAAVTPGSPLANRQHPRIYLTAANIPSYRTKLSGEFRDEYQSWIDYLDSIFASAERDDEYHAHARNFAFVYRVGRVPGISYSRDISEYGDKARALF